MVKDRNEQQAAALLRIAAIIKSTKISPEALDQLHKAVKRRSRQKQNTTVGTIVVGLRSHMEEVFKLMQLFEHESADELVLELLSLL